ncbi:hypothetical protein LPB72_20825 [Hydrogenophaga crassostreae]|uniref:Response regulatory domain-containing protein n=1 Tax=Hydrogenophaga crassostreae TaxID=1763535 RepID=A0A167GNM2_9BURK|nr:hypothetical protein [Hydrogenophaga crassostreae]AOW14871.1 hypothetical protein LPB072_20655 [Hydrogenophaga crassostreae]OAD39697.1 hypothetical protein LPB72_20825 [Hydrogenophaga crassostreae]
MSIAAFAKAPKILLVDADNTVRGTVASVCRDLNVARVTQATSVSMAEQHLRTGRLSGLVLSMGEEVAALALLTRLRAGDFPCGPEVAVVVMAHECTADLARQLKALKVRRLLLQPFKLRDVIQTLEQLWEEGVGSSSGPGDSAVPEDSPEPVEPPEAAEPKAVAEDPGESGTAETIEQDSETPPDTSTEDAAEPTEADASA